jgi:Flp pilus assembly protein TadD
LLPESKRIDPTAQNELTKFRQIKPMSSTATAMAAQSEKASRTRADTFLNPRARTIALCSALAVLTAAFYLPVLHNGFTNLDDEAYITHNLHVRAGLKWDTVKWAFTTFETGNWHPVTWLTHALDCQLFGLNPAAHHSVNVLLHAANAVLLFLLLETATGFTWPSLVVAALFAFHPVNVESVAWAAERKNALSMFFFLLAMYAYGWYVRRESAKRYAVVVLLFAIGLMAKPEIITLPFILLLWDYWPLRRMFASSSTENSSGTTPHSFAFLILEKLPLLLLSAASGAVTVLAEKANDSVRGGLSAARVGNAVVAYVRYLGKALWPAHLAVMYPYHGHLLSSVAIFASVAVLLFATTIVLYYHDRRYLTVGWFWFLGTLVPVIGVVEIGMQAMADRYAYLPDIGLWIAVVWGAEEAARKRDVRPAHLAAPVLLVLSTLGVLTWRQTTYWYDGETLWRHTLSVTVRNPVAHDGLGYALAEKGRVEEAIAEYNEVEALHGYAAPAILGVGIYEQTHGHVQEAIGQYKQSLDASPDATSRATALAHMGSAFMQLGDLENAKQGYAYALHQNPDNTLALVGGGLLAQREGNFEPAISLLARAIKLEPTGVHYLLLAQMLTHFGRMEEGAQAFARAQQMSHDWSQTQQDAAQKLASAGIKQN